VKQLAKVHRDKKGRVLTGSVLNPDGVTEVDRTLHNKISALCRSILEEAAFKGGPTVFERTVKILLAPIIGVPRDKDGKPIGEPYLVNEHTMLRTVEFLARRGYGREPGPLPEDKEPEISGKTRGMIVILHAPRPVRAPIEVKLQPQRIAGK